MHVCIYVDVYIPLNEGDLTNIHFSVMNPKRQAVEYTQHTCIRVTPPFKDTRGLISVLVFSAF